MTLYEMISSGEVGGVRPPSHPIGRTSNPLTSTSDADQAKCSRSAVSVTVSDTSVRKPGSMPVGIACGG